MRRSNCIAVSEKEEADWQLPTPVEFIIPISITDVARRGGTYRRGSRRNVIYTVRSMQLSVPAVYRYAGILRMQMPRARAPTRDMIKRKLRFIG